MRCVIERDFLGREFNSRQFAFAVRNQAKFTPSAVWNGVSERLDPDVRVSRHHSDLGGLRAEIVDRLLPRVPQWTRDLGLSPFVPNDVETEMVVSGHGAFYKPHIDTLAGVARRATTDRILSAVYYFHREPKAFSGGALRLHPMPGPELRSGVGLLDVDPEQDMLVVFPSWTMHEVLPVSCNAQAFENSRFSVNCWILRATRPARAGAADS